MRVREYSAERLRLTEWPVGLALGLAAVNALPMLMAWGYFRAGELRGGIALTVIALVLLVGCFGVFVRQIEIVLDRKAGTVSVSQRGLFNNRRKALTLQGVRGAMVQTHVVQPRRSQPGERPRKRKPVRTFRPMLVYVSGRTEPLLDIFSSGNAASVTASAINGWMEGDSRPRPPLPIDAAQA